MKDGVTVSQAATDADRVAQQIVRSFPPTMSRIRIGGDVKLLSDVITGDTRPLLRMLLVAMSVVLLIACVNIAILMLVRAVRNHLRFPHSVRRNPSPSMRCDQSSSLDCFAAIDVAG